MTTVSRIHDHLFGRPDGQGHPGGYLAKPQKKLEVAAPAQSSGDSGVVGVLKRPDSRARVREPARAIRLSGVGARSFFAGKSDPWKEARVQNHPAERASTSATPAGSGYSWRRTVFEKSIQSGSPVTGFLHGRRAHACWRLSNIQEVVGRCGVVRLPAARSTSMTSKIQGSVLGAHVGHARDGLSFPTETVRKQLENQVDRRQKWTVEFSSLPGAPCVRQTRTRRVRARAVSPGPSSIPAWSQLAWGTAR